MDGLLLAGGQAAEAKVGMQAAGHALEQFLIRLGGHGEYHFFVSAEAADESVTGRELGNRARVDIINRYLQGPPNLARGVACLSGPVPGRHASEFAVDEDET